MLILLAVVPLKEKELQFDFTKMEVFRLHRPPKAVF